MNLHIDPAEFVPLIEQIADAVVRRLVDEREYHQAGQDSRRLWINNDS